MQAQQVDGAFLYPASLVVRSPGRGGETSPAKLTNPWQSPWKGPVSSDGGAWSRFHALEPGGDVLVGRIERLADALHEVEEGEQKDIGRGDPAAGDERLAGHQAVQPLELVPGGRLQPVGRLRDAADAVLEQLQPLGEAKAVGRRLDDVEIDAPRPHAGDGALRRRVADQRGLVALQLVDIFADRRD